MDSTGFWRRAGCLRWLLPRFGAVALFALENQGDWRVLWPYDADRHSAIRGKGVAFLRNHSGLRGGHL